MELLGKSKQQLTEMIRRDRNKASIILWSVANETPVSEPRTRFLTTLADTARKLDPTRLVSAAMEVHADTTGGNMRTVEDPLAAL